MLCSLLNPGILMVCIFNFGPIRNTLTLYLDHIPEHLSCALCPCLRRYFPKVGKDDQRNIVEAAREDLERAISPKQSKHSQHKNVKRRNSTVSSTDSSKSSVDQLPFMQCWVPDPVKKSLDMNTYACDKIFFTKIMRHNTNFSYLMKYVIVIKVVLVLCKVAWADSCVIIVIAQGSAHATLRSTRMTLIEMK